MWLILGLQFIFLALENSSQNTNPEFILIESNFGQLAEEIYPSIGNPMWKNRLMASFKIKYIGKKETSLNPENIKVEYQAELANSRIPAHRFSKTAKAKFLSFQKASAEIIKGKHWKDDCRENLILVFNRSGFPQKLIEEKIIISSGEEFFLTLIIEHEHFICGQYDPLLGKRIIKLTINDTIIREEFLINELDEQKRIPEIKLSDIPKERLDDQYFISPPDSLYLGVDPGAQFFRFKDLHLPPNSVWKLSFWYLIAVNSEGKTKVRIGEYQDTIDSWHKLSDAFDETLFVQGRWQYFEKQFTITLETTTIAVDFRILEATAAETWIDEVKLKYAHENSKLGF
jgi:hypothetical protein